MGIIGFIPFELGLSLRVRNILQIHYIFPDTAIENNSQPRYKRYVQCDRDLSGPALIFDFNLTYPINRICQSQKCLNETFAEIYEQFQSVPSLLVDFNNTQRELLLRSFDVIPYSVDLIACLKKILITQESVAPYRINYTSTLFFQDDHSLVVVGASKLKTLINHNRWYDGI